LWVYVQESKEERQKKLRELEEENRVRQERIAFQQAQARIPGTEEYEYIAGLNRDIAEYDRTRKPGEPRKMSRRPEWEFKEEPPTRSPGGGMDWYLYMHEVLHSRLYPFIERLQSNGDFYWLVEDNAGSHLKATRYDKEKAEANRDSSC
jgi:hypothetical protein